MQDDKVKGARDGLGRWEQWGHGPHRVLLLSNPQADPAWWSRFLREGLADDWFTVTAFVHEPHGHDWFDVVRIVVSFIEDVIEEPVLIVGWSQGAAIAQEVALAHPLLVQAVALLAPYGRPNRIDAVLQQAWDVLADGDTDLNPLRLALGLLTSQPPHSLGDDAFVGPLIDAADSWALTPNRTTRHRAADFIASYPDRLGALKAIHVPTLVLGFELDTDTFVTRAREVADAIPCAEYVEIAGAGHLAPVTDADAVWPFVIKFLDRQSGAS